MAYTIRDARETDLRAILDVLTHYIQTTKISYDITAPDLATFTERF
jgi:L-amino acid N-acyltransferase YncA